MSLLPCVRAVPIAAHECGERAFRVRFFVGSVGAKDQPGDSGIRAGSWPWHYQSRSGSLQENGTYRVMAWWHLAITKFDGTPSAKLSTSSLQLPSALPVPCPHNRSIHSSYGEPTFPAVATICRSRVTCTLHRIGPKLLHLVPTCRIEGTRFSALP